MPEEECIVCEKMIEFETKFSPDFCDECQEIENVNGNRFANTSFEELVRYHVELEGEKRELELENEKLRLEIGNIYQTQSHGTGD